MATTTKAAEKATPEKDPTKAFEREDGHVLYASTPEQEVNLRARGYTEKNSSK